MRTNKITRAGFFLALGIILPQAFHLTGVPQSGVVFLPMHIPVMMAGIMLGPLYGLIIGTLSPILSYLFTGMPGVARLPFMIGELAGYGLVIGFMLHKLRFYEKSFGTIISLITSMIVGRGIYAVMILIADSLFNTNIGIIAVRAAITMGLAGILIQIVFIPSFIYLLRKRGLLNEFIR